MDLENRFGLRFNKVLKNNIARIWQKKVKVYRILAILLFFANQTLLRKHSIQSFVRPTLSHLQ